MTFTQKLPACHHSIKEDHGADILYTLAKYTAPKHLDNTDASAFHSLLCAAHIITENHPLPQKQDAATCFQVIAKYHCGYLCSMCSYSARNKNHLETEESILLSYALKNFQSFQFLKKAGLTAEHFQSIFLLNSTVSGKIVPTIPLLRLSYSYIEHIGNSNLSFHELPAMIANALDQNNRGKLLPQNVQSIKTYLETLQTQCASLTEEKLKNPLSLVLHPEHLTKTSFSEENSAKENITKASMETAEEKCIDGLLTAPVTKPSKKEIHPMTTTSQQFNKKDQMAFQTNSTICKSSQTQTFSLMPDIFPSEEGLFYPAVFSLHEADQTGYPFYAISENAADLRQLEVFLQFNPLVGIEIVTDAGTGKQMVLLCASNQFYYAPIDSEAILSLFGLYFAKSSIRRQICMEPYKAYYFLQHHNIYCQNIYSLRSAYRILAKAKGDTTLKKPSQMIKELVSRTNTYGYSPYIFSMLQYVKMYEVLSKHPLLCQKKYVQELKTISSIEMFLGISYELKDVADTQKSLFDLDNKLECQFHYTPDLKLKEGIYSVSFTFTHEKPVQSLVTNILCRIAQKNLAHMYGYRLLRFSPDSFTIATTEKYYGQLCEIVANLSTYLAEKQDLISLIVKENKS